MGELRATEVATAGHIHIKGTKPKGTLVAKENRFCRKKLVVRSLNTDTQKRKPGKGGGD